MDVLYNIQKTTFWCFEIRMARAGIVSPGDFEESRFNCIKRINRHPDERYQ